jgi:tetratricopeptide (TPR) repeat protein
MRAPSRSRTSRPTSVPPGTTRSPGDGPARRRIAALSRRGDRSRLDGDYEEAYALFRRALAIAETAPEPRLLAAALNNLGTMCKYTGRFDEGAGVYRRAIRIADDPALEATLLHNLGGLEHARGDYARAERFARCGAELRASERGPDHPEVAADRVALGAILDGLGRHHDSIPMYEHALGVFERAYGSNHPEVGATLHNLAGALAMIGRWQDAERAARRALAIKRRALGSRHPEVASCLHNLAVMMGRRGDLTRAAKLGRRALAILERVWPAGDPRLEVVRDALSSFEPLSSSARSAARPRAGRSRPRARGTSRPPRT